MVYKNETITISNTATGFTVANIDLASLYWKPLKRITFSLEGAQIRAWDNATPEASVGEIINIGDIVEVSGDNAKTFRAIKTGGTDGTISCAYEV